MQYNVPYNVPYNMPVQVQDVLQNLQYHEQINTTPSPTTQPLFDTKDHHVNELDVKQTNNKVIEHKVEHISGTPVKDKIVNHVPQFTGNKMELIQDTESTDENDSIKIPVYKQKDPDDIQSINFPIYDAIN